MPHDFGNHVVRAANPHARANGNPLALDIAPVVQCRLAHGHTVKINRFNMRDGRQLARAPHIPRHVADDSRRLLRLKLERNRPAREAVRVAHHLAGGKVADLDEHAVNQEVETAAFLLDMVDAVLNFVDAPALPQIWADLKAVCAQEIKHPLLRGVRRIVNRANLIEKRIEMAGGGHGGVKVAERSGGGVSGIFQRFFRRLVVGIQCGQAHDAFALHLQQSPIRYRQRHGADGLCLRQNRLASDAVAACRRLNQPALVVGQVQRQAVEFILNAVLQVVLPAELLGAANPILHRADGLCLIHAPQAVDVRMRRKRRHHFAADPVRRGIRQDDARLLFQRRQFVIELVPIHVGHNRLAAEIVRLRRLIERVRKLTHPRRLVCHA